MRRSFAHRRFAIARCEKQWLLRFGDCVITAALTGAIRLTVSKRPAGQGAVADYSVFRLQISEWLPFSPSMRLA